MLTKHLFMYALSAISLFLNKMRRLKFHHDLGPTVRIAKSALVHTSALIIAGSGHVEIGENSTLNELCVIQGLGGVKIGNGVRIACHTVITSVNHRFDRLDMPIWKQGTYGKPIVIEDDVWIGAHCTILGGVKIGAHSVIGAHSLVTRDVPPYSVAFGVPCEVQRSRKSP